MSICTSLSSLWTRGLGYASLVGLIISWIAQSEVAQVLETTLQYNKPCLITWVNHSFSILLFPVLYLQHCLQRRCTGTTCSGWLLSLHNQGLTFKRVLSSSALLGFLYFGADMMWYVGLTRTSVAAGTAIFNSSCAVTYVLSVICLATKVSFFPVLGLLATLTGVALISGAEKTDSGLTANGAVSGGEKLVGALLIFGAAVAYAGFEVGFSVILKRNNLASTAVVVNGFSAAFGLFNIVFLWPAVLAVHIAPQTLPSIHEAFEWPTSMQLVYLLMNGSLAFMFNVCFLLAIALTSPVLTSISCVLTIPVAAVVDLLLWGKGFTVMEGAGSMLISCGFAILAVSEHFAKRMEEQQSPLLDQTIQCAVQLNPGQTATC